MSDPTNEPQDSQQEPTVEDPYEQLLASITDDDGRPKYDSVEKALEGTAHAQKHISTVEDDNRKLRERMEKMESFFDKFEQQQASKADQPKDEPATQEPSVDPDKLFEQFEARLAQQQQAQTKEQNKKTALETVLSHYGSEKAADVIKERASDAGMDYRDLLSLAETSPKAFNKIVGIGDRSQKPSSFARSSVNSAAMPDNPQKPQAKNPLLSGRTQDAVDLWKSLGQQ